MKTQTSNPKISPARAAAFDILMRVEKEDGYASEMLHARKYQDLSSLDHGLATQITLGVLRWRSTIDETVRRASSKKLAQMDAEVLTALRMGVFQIQYLERIPAHAAIFESVELVKRARKRSAVPFVNAVLRKVPVERHSSVVEDADDAATLASVSAHPMWLVERWTASYGLDQTRRICAHNQSTPVAAIHFHDNAAEEELIREGVELQPGALLNHARRVRSGDVTKTRAFRERRISVQDEASQLVALLVGTGQTILDCCAAPGGKTRSIAERNPKSRVFATELHPHRAALLQRLAGAENVRVIAADARQLPFTSEFDRVLVDVPCSGTGTLARNPEIKWRLKANDLEDLADRQVAILQSVLERVESAGKLVYASCSLEPEENEAVVEKVLSKATGFQVASCREELASLRDAGELSWGDLDSLISGDYLRTIPGVHPCDGFFAAILERR
ncbi:MAG TPA: 16S rRNA (cytosine(967)-C(5))-methyltransferase RsmB [Terriglobales bacterium]|nr:16S rRNA (cytosine(967)-C(5))-methyltransferase RsmB [Terriglobales bacterium]